MGGDRAVYWVEGLDTAAPVFHEDYGFVIPDDLFTRSVLDFAPLKEKRDDVWIDDGEAKGEYLVGLAQAFELVVVRLGDDGAPDAYAVIPGVADWRSRTPQSGTSAFGAAFTYRSATWGDAQVFFASNEGWGLFELELPVVVPEGCWNADEETQNHVVCEASSASLVYRMASLDASSNDGLNCETQAFVAFEDPTRAPTTGDPTPAPSFEPSRAPSAKPTYAPTSAAPSEGAVEPFDCAAAGNPIQVLREKDDEHYRVAELAPSVAPTAEPTGACGDFVYELEMTGADWADASVVISSDDASVFEIAPEAAGVVDACLPDGCYLCRIQIFKSTSM